MTKNSISIYHLFLGSLVVFSSCKDKADTPKPNEENELITKVHLHLVAENDSTKMIHAEWSDLTPDDEAGRSIDTLRLDTGTVYVGEIELSDQSKNPAVDISEEVEEEKDDHLFIYRQDPLDSSVRFTFERTDKDSKGLPVGLKFRLTSKNLIGNTRLQVILKHQPGIKDGSEAPGDADLDVWFPVKIR
jgi:hypothetical protein